MGDPSTTSVVFIQRNWEKRQRRANFGSVVSNVCMLSPIVAVRETDPRRSSEYQGNIKQNFCRRVQVAQNGSAGHAARGLVREKPDRDQQLG
jgi:hypothetical protein